MSQTFSPPLFKKSDFPLLEQKMEGKDLIYFDSAATTQKPKQVIHALSHFYAESYATVHRAAYSLSLQATEKYNRVREQVAQFLHAAHTDEIIFTKGTTEAINLVAASFGEQFLFPGDEVLISAMEHHSNIVPWQMICKKRGAHLKVIPVLDSGELDFQAYLQLLSSRTKIVSITHVSNVLGTINPLAKIIEEAHAFGAKVFVDGAQSASHMRVDVQALNADFFAFSSHKAYGPTGIGILYGKRDILEQMPPYQGGGDMIQSVSFEESFFQPPPLRFEAGTPSIGDTIGFGAALTYLSEHGLDQIAEYEKELTTYALKKMQACKGVNILGPLEKRGALISFTIEGMHPLDVGMWLNLKGIAVRTGHLCAQPILRRFGHTSVLRVSFAPYNTFAEVDYFIEALKDVRKWT